MRASESGLAKSSCSSSILVLAYLVLGYSARREQPTRKVIRLLVLLVLQLFTPRFTPCDHSIHQGDTSSILGIYHNWLPLPSYSPSFSDYSTCSPHRIRPPIRTTILIMSSITWLFASAVLVLLMTMAISRSRRWRSMARVGLDPGYFGFKVQAAKREFAADGHRLVGRA